MPRKGLLASADAHHMGQLAELAEAQLAWAARSRVGRGFGWLTENGTPDRGRPSELWITARMVHVFALASAQGDDRWDKELLHGVRALSTDFRDAEYGGWFTCLGRHQPHFPKRLYDHAFVVLAGSSLASAQVDRGVDILAEALAVVGTRFWEPLLSLGRESFSADWASSEPYRGLNANMHLVEAYLAAGHTRGDNSLYLLALEIARTAVDGWARSRGWRIPEHFGTDWTFTRDYNIDQPADPFRPYGVTPGHGLEWARLLLQLGTVVDHATEPWLLPAATSLTRRALSEGWIEPGGLVYTTDFEGSPIVTERFHWGACEALATVASLYAVTGDSEWDDWYEQIWTFMVDHLVLPDGSLLHEVDSDLAPSRRTWSGRPDVYHAYQALLIPRGRPRASVMALAQSLTSSRGNGTERGRPGEEPTPRG